MAGRPCSSGVCARDDFADGTFRVAASARHPNLEAPSDPADGLSVANVVVVGAGVGGLASAALLTAARHQVTVLEAAQGVGGKLGTVARQTSAGTFRFDTGPSLLTMPDVFAELFARTGGRLDSVLGLQPLDPIVRYRFADGTNLTTTRDLDEQVSRFDYA